MPLGKPTPPNARPRRGTQKVTLTKAKPDPLQGRVVLDRYRINSRLARGGMASIYLARDVKEGGLFAVKVLRRDMVLETNARVRFLNECRAIQRINHPNVVRICDIGETEDARICLVMEYIEGVTLRKLIEDSPIPSMDVAAIAHGVALGLRAAHDQCVVHRDLKPENVLVKKRMGRVRTSDVEAVKLVDFGIARIIDAPRITTTQHIMGTPQYIAPEQALGKPVDSRVDIYALGVMMYEMLTGELPFQGDDPDILLRQHISIPPPPLSVHNVDTDIPDELQHLVMRCLSKSPKNRPAEAGEILHALGSFLE